MAEAKVAWASQPEEGEGEQAPASSQALAPPLVALLLAAWASQLVAEEGAEAGQACGLSAEEAEALALG